jgi:hypothetical protein
MELFIQDYDKYMARQHRKRIKLLLNHVFAVHSDSHVSGAYRLPREGQYDPGITNSSSSFHAKYRRRHSSGSGERQSQRARGHSSSSGKQQSQRARGHSRWSGSSPQRHTGVSEECAPRHRRRTSRHSSSCDAHSHKAKRTKGTVGNIKRSRSLDLDIGASSRSQSGRGRPSKSRVRLSGRRQNTGGGGQQQQQKGGKHRKTGSAKQQEHFRRAPPRMHSHRQEFRKEFRQHRQNCGQRRQHSAKHKRRRLALFLQQEWLHQFFGKNPHLQQDMACLQLCC